jgi:hypothetical protein
MQRFLEEVGARKQPLAAHLEQAAVLRFEAGRLLILLPPGDAYLSSRLRQPANRETIAAAVAQTWGPSASWDFIEGLAPIAPLGPLAPIDPLAPTSPPGAGGTGAALAGPQPAELSAAVLNPAVQTLLDIFGGKVEAVEEHHGSREE